MSDVPFKPTLPRILVPPEKVVRIDRVIAMYDNDDIDANQMVTKIAEIIGLNIIL